MQEKRGSLLEFNQMATLMCLKKMADVVFFRQNPAMNSPLHRARADSAAISRSCHCIIGERLPRLRAEGQVQGLRSVTPLQCLSFITTLKTATHPCVFCPPPSEQSLHACEVVTLCDNVTRGYCFNTWQREERTRYERVLLHMSK